MPGRKNRSEGSKIARDRRLAMAQAAAADVNPEKVAAALLNSGGDVEGALRGIGLIDELTTPPQVRRIMVKAFNPDVMRRLTEEFSDLQKQKSKLISRQVRIARFGDADTSTRAFSQLARVAGWLAPTNVRVTGEQRIVNIHTLMQNPEMLRDALETFGEHEPGAAVATFSEARDRFEQKHGKVAIEAETIDGELADDE